ncbi:hypothetical protein MTO96_031394, partial [Rhipicephalus appendiculatus]
MPANDTMIPAWFKNADASFSALKIPVEMQGALILPFLSDAMRTLVIGQSLSGTLYYAELKEKVLKELKMTPAEYRRRFLGYAELEFDSGEDITVIKASEVPAEALRQRCGHVKLTGAFGQAIMAEVMYVPLGLPCPVGNGNQRVPVLCAVTPELAASADLLLTPDDYESLRFAVKEAGCYATGGGRGVVGEPSKQVCVRGNVEPVAQAGTGEAGRVAEGEETNKRANGDACWEVNADLKDKKAVDQSSEITEHEEVEPQSDDQGEMVSMAHMHAAGDSLQ